MIARLGVLLAVVGLAACSSSGSSAPSTTAVTTTTTAASTTTTTVTPTTSVATTAAPSTTAVATTTVAPTTTTTTVAVTTTAVDLKCHPSELAASLGEGQGAAGSSFIPLVLRNIGTRSCVIAGYPGVSLLDATGQQLGDPANREVGGSNATVTVKPGASASALLHTTNGPIGGPCLAPSVKMKVFPPNQFDALVFRGVYTACGGFSVRPFVAGSAGG